MGMMGFDSIPFNIISVQRCTVISHAYNMICNFLNLFLFLLFIFYVSQLADSLNFFLHPQEDLSSTNGRNVEVR